MKLKYKGMNTAQMPFTTAPPGAGQKLNQGTPENAHLNDAVGQGRSRCGEQRDEAIRRLRLFLSLAKQRKKNN